MSQKTRATSASRLVAVGVPVSVPGEELEGARVRPGEDVALLDPAEAVDGRAVEGHPLVERVLELGRGDREGLRGAEHVGEPELDEADAALFHGPEDVLLLAPDHVGDLRARRRVTGCGSMCSLSQAAGDPVDKSAGTRRSSHSRGRRFRHRFAAVNAP